MAVTLKTEDKLEYTFYPAVGRQIQFRVRAPHDVHVALTTGPAEADPMLEVFIGGWKNTKSVIRKDRTKPDVVEIETPDILNGDEFRGFWIRWNDNVVRVGKENDLEPFLSFDNPDPLQITHFGVCTGWGATGDWQIEEPKENLCWCDATSGVVPPGAMVAGHDGGETLYVGRAKHEGALLPGKVKPEHGVCYVPWGGQEFSKEEYQVLCNCNGTWVPTYDNIIPPNAVLGGTSEDKEPLYIGRVEHEGTLTPGKVHPSHETLYIPYGGKELSFTEYEILVE